MVLINSVHFTAAYYHHIKSFESKYAASSTYVSEHCVFVPSNVTVVLGRPSNISMSLSAWYTSEMRAVTLLHVSDRGYCYV